MIYFGEWMNVSVVRGGALLLPYSSFLALMQEKKAKENQGARGTGQVGRVHDRWDGGFEEVGRVHDRWNRGPGRVFTLLTVRSSGAYGRAGVWDG